MTKFKALSFLTAAVMSVGSMGFSVFADTAYELGDVDMDGVVTGHDTAMVSRHLLDESYDLTEEQLSYADVNRDGAVTQADADKLYSDMEEYALGCVYFGFRYNPKSQGLCDASIILDYYSYAGAGMEYDWTPVQENLADLNLDEKVDLVDCGLVLALYALRGGGYVEPDEVPVEGIYYYSNDPESPAYVGDLHGGYAEYYS